MRQIILDGVKLPHKIGDTVYWLYAKDTELSIEVREEKSFVSSIKITSDRVIYLDEDDQDIEGEETLFWSREEAQKWLDEHMPKELIFKKGDFVFFIRQSYASIDVDCGEVEELIISDNKVKYVIRTPSFSSIHFTEEEAKKMTFFDKDEAIKFRDELRAAKEILYKEEKNL